MRAPALMAVLIFMDVSSAERFPDANAGLDGSFDLHAFVLTDRTPHADAGLDVGFDLHRGLLTDRFPDANTGLDAGSRLHRGLLGMGCWTAVGSGCPLLRGAANQPPGTRRRPRALTLVLTFIAVPPFLRLAGERSPALLETLSMLGWFRKRNTDDASTLVDTQKRTAGSPTVLMRTAMGLVLAHWFPQPCAGFDVGPDIHRRSPPFRSALLAGWMAQPSTKTCICTCVPAGLAAEGCVLHCRP